MGSGQSNTSNRILVLGIDGAGKTSFLNKYENPGGAEIDVQPTDGFIVKDVKVKGVKLNVWDVAGKEATRSLWKHYYEQGHTDAIIWVVDSADSDERLEESRSALQGALLDPHLQGTSFFYQPFYPPSPTTSLAFPKLHFSSVFTLPLLLIATFTLPPAFPPRHTFLFALLTAISPQPSPKNVLFEFFSLFRHFRHPCCAYHGTLSVCHSHTGGHLLFYHLYRSCSMYNLKKETWRFFDQIA